MDLTARYVANSRTVITQVEAADITNPDLPRPQLAALVTRVTETLRTTSDHAERLQQSHDQLRAENGELEQQVRALHAALAETSA
jgi:hypothetical protein